MAEGDIRIYYNDTLWECDMLFQENDLLMDHGLVSAVFVSLFTDRRARADDTLPDPDGSRRGWWGDTLLDLDNHGDKIGSRLWLLSREKTENEVLRRAEDYTREALKWMTEDGVAAKVDAEAYRQGPVGNDVLAILAKIHKTDGEVVNLRFESEWYETFNTDYGYYGAG